VTEELQTPKVVAVGDMWGDDGLLFNKDVLFLLEGPELGCSWGEKARPT